MTELNNEYPIMDKMDKMEARKSAYPRLFNNNYTIMADYILKIQKDMADRINNAIEELKGNFTPAGTIVGLPSDTVPVGYLLCDGRLLLREDSSENANDGTDVTDGQESTLYAGKYKSVDFFYMKIVLCII